MKAIIENNKTYKVTGERGDFWIAESNGKVKMFAKKNVEVIEVAEIVEKKYKQVKSTRPVSNVNNLMTVLSSELDNSLSARRIITLITSNVDMSEIVASILNQANRNGGRISEKQIYVVAKFIDDNNISVNF